jgi:hypothetical protein
MLCLCSAPPGRGPALQQAAQPSSTRLTTNDALSYLRDVKNRFVDQKEVYETFLDIMKEFKAARSGGSLAYCRCEHADVAQQSPPADVYGRALGPIHMHIHGR